MFEFEETMLGLSDQLEYLKTDDNNNNNNNNVNSKNNIQLPSGKGNNIIKQLKEIDSNPPSQYNSDTDEPAPRKSKEYCRTKKLELSEDYIAEPSKSKVNKDDFDTLCVLGCGAFGKVYLVKHQKNQQLLAMKVLKKASLVVHGKQSNQIKTERQILEEVRHPFIVKLYYAFQTKHELHMLLTYCVGGELFRHLNHEGMFSESMAKFYAAELILALEHLHSLGIIYRDLKPENCLLDEKGHVVLTDFGLSKVSMDGKTNTICGTIEYMAPEILMGLQYDYVVDWWSLGILIYDMLTGSPPFSGKHRQRTMDSILSKKITMPYYFTSDARDLLSKLLRKNPNARLGAKPKKTDALRKHPFFSKINWKDLENRKVTPPICPVVTNPELAENFDSEFTNQPIVGSPTQDSFLQHHHFRDFSFVDSSLI